jgi:hypothetical protein
LVKSSIAEGARARIPLANKAERKGSMVGNYGEEYENDINAL